MSNWPTYANPAWAIIAIGAVAASAGAGIVFRQEIQNRLITSGAISCPSNSDGRAVLKAVIANMDDRVTHYSAKVEICDRERGWHPMYIFGQANSVTVSKCFGINGGSCNADTPKLERGMRLIR